MVYNIFFLKLLNALISINTAIRNYNPPVMDRRVAICQGLLKILAHLQIEMEEGRFCQFILSANCDLNSTSWSRLSVWFFFTSSVIEYPENFLINTLKSICK